MTVDQPDVRISFLEPYTSGPQAARAWRNIQILFAKIKLHARLGLLRRHQRHIFWLLLGLAEALLREPQESHPINRERGHFLNLHGWLPIIVLIIEGISLFLLLTRQLFDIDFAALFVSERRKLLLVIISSGTIIMNGFNLELLFLGCEFHFWLSEGPAYYG